MRILHPGRKSPARANVTFWGPNGDKAPELHFPGDTAQAALPGVLTVGLGSALREALRIVSENQI